MGLQEMFFAVAELGTEYLCISSVVFHKDFLKVDTRKNGRCCG